MLRFTRGLAFALLAFAAVVGQAQYQAGNLPCVLGRQRDIFRPKPQITLRAGHEPELGARVRTQDKTAVFSIARVAKSPVKDATTAAAIASTATINCL